MGARPVARVGLKRTLPLHVCARTLLKVVEPTMLATRSKSVKRATSVLQSASFPGSLQACFTHARLVSSQSFPHLWKKLWKSARSFGLLGLRLDFLGVLVEAKVREHDKLPLPLNGSS